MIDELLLVLCAILIMWLAYMWDKAEKRIKQLEGVEK